MASERFVFLCIKAYAIDSKVMNVSWFVMVGLSPCCRN